MDWTEDVILRLREFWTEGHSTAEIGRRLGVTKNAVVGKVHRLHLTARPSPIRRDVPPIIAANLSLPICLAVSTLPPLLSLPAPASVPVNADESPEEIVWAATNPDAEIAIAPAPVTSPAVMPPPPRSVPRAVPAAAPRIAATRSHARLLTCSWPIGDPGTKSFHFCDDGAVSGKPYCAAHIALAYVRVRDRREDAA